jgi:hypothetical protein
MLSKGVLDRLLGDVDEWRHPKPGSTVAKIRGDHEHHW